MNQKPYFSLAAVSLLALAVTGCAASGTASETSAASGGDTAAPLYQSVPAEFRDGITVAVQVNAPPLSFKGVDGTAQGEDPELLAALSKQLGIPIKIEQVSFENMLLGLNQKKYDFITQTNITTERMKIYDQLSQFNDGYNFITLKSTADFGATIDDLCGKTIASQTGDQATEYLQRKSDACTSAGKQAIKLVQLPSLPEGYLTVASGRAEAAVAPTSTLSYFLSQQKQQLGKEWKLTGPSILSVYAGYSFPKGSKLITVVQQGIDALMKDRTYEAILTKHGLSENIADSAQVNPTPPSAD
ncbi:ABC transporter substrate-binding protein [Acrocarpospora pleiomorpha]|uniref:ABC transporter substrate-binding protein n=1 Tax=Acrocarpospora pleiomorpha TaxID=90975 RepID=A0A5M3XFK1_9ACTN|nr:transporter substrate-binding domain-containing protein [Acrocarpospora pleiomorpha]GES20044.1 ABC transporter substrate-binding protein [Acrocarpospora pleiomorpha]